MDECLIVHRLPVSNWTGEEEKEDKVGGRQRNTCFDPV